MGRGILLNRPYKELFMIVFSDSKVVCDFYPKHFCSKAYMLCVSFLKLYLNKTPADNKASIYRVLGVC